MGSCDRGSAVVGFLFMVLICGDGLCNDGCEAMVVVSTSRFVGCGGFFFWVRFEFGLVGCGPLVCYALMVGCLAIQVLVVTMVV